MNFSSNRFQKLSGLLTESVEDKKDEEVSENEVVEAMAAEMASHDGAMKKLRQEFPDIPTQELDQLVGSVSPRMSPEGRKVQRRYQQLTGKTAAEMEKEGDGLKEFDMGDALKTGSVALKVAKAVLDVIKKDPTLQKEISEVLPENLVPHFQSLVASGSPKAVDVKETRLRQFIRGEIDSAWATGEVFGRKAPRTKGVTMGFAGIGFKK